MSEMEDTADPLVVVGRGRLLADALTRSGAQVAAEDDGALRVSGMEPAAVGEVTLATGVSLHELTRVTGSLEEAYLTLSGDDVEYRAGTW